MPPSIQGGLNGALPEVGAVELLVLEVLDAPVLTVGGGFPRGSLLELGGGDGGGGTGGVADDIEDDASCHELLVALVALFTGLLLFAAVLGDGAEELTEGGGTYELPVGGGGGIIRDPPEPFIGNAGVWSRSDCV